jgi:hypothetical protein
LDLQTFAGEAGARMLRFLTSCLSFGLLVLPTGLQTARAIWSVVAVDARTGEIGGASATCTPWALQYRGGDNAVTLLRKMFDEHVQH